MSDKFFEEIYEECQEIINPHITPLSHGGCAIGKDSLIPSLIPSVIESLEYLVEFWLANKDKDGIDLCGIR